MIAAALVAAAAQAEPAVATFARVRFAAERALLQLRRANPDADATWQANLPGPALLTGLQEPAHGADPTAQALAFARAHAAVWGVAALQLQLIERSASRDRDTVRLGLAAQVGSRSVPVLDRSLVVTLDRSRGQIATVASDLLPVGALKAPTVTENAATLRALKSVGLCEGPAACAEFARATPARLAVWAELTGATPVWVVDVAVAGPLKRTVVLVDAWTGAALRATPVAIH